jgi:putative transcriptional regulator
MTALRVPDEMLLAYATGALSEPLSLVVASHLALNPDSRAEVETFEAVGGALVEALPPAEMGGDALERTLAKLDLLEESEAEGQVCVPVKQPAKDGLPLPSPLRHYVGGDIEALSWKSVLRGVEEAELPVARRDGARTSLMRIAPGTRVPRHTHGGIEMTLVLTGAFRDESGLYARGDMQLADGAVEHQPVAEGEETCLCLVVSDAPVRLTGFFGRLLNPFIKH